MHPMPQHAALLAIGVTLVSCGDSSGTGRVNMQIATRPQLPVAASAAPASFSAGGSGQTFIELGGDQLVLNQVELVLRKVKLEGAAAGACGGVAFGVKITKIGMTVEQTPIVRRRVRRAAAECS